jgi:eukaryotic-like serine/threonine-protein kinase
MRIGPYEVIASLGAGGMGEVYRARDARLDRDVAIKVLLDSSAQDPERLARFEREAKTLATLNHPNIASIHGLVEGPAEAGAHVRALVLEFVDGPTLADRLAHGPMPLDEAIPVARQIADALQAAHDLGIVHRDLKPANIKIRPDGTVKVLDFGLAKILDPAPTPPSQTMSPTLSLQATLAGVILGTAAYMSPEQARGKVVDRRTDIWSFGCVLFEMLAGKRAFEGDDFTVTIAAVVRGEPDWSALGNEVPQTIRLLLQRCLEKDPRTRVADIAVARFLLTETIATAFPTAGRQHPNSRRRVLMMAALSAAVGVALAAVAGWVMLRSRPQISTPSVHFSVQPPPTQSLVNTTDNRDLVVSPDGRRVVFVVRAGGGTALAVRAIDQIEPQVLPGTEAARSPFISPDGRWVGFFVTLGSSSEIKKVPIAGGAASTIAKVDGFSRGASWSEDDRIVFATSDLTTGLLAVPASGGEPTVLTKAATGELDHQFPCVLPGGRAILFTITGENGSPSGRRIAVLDTSTGQMAVVARGRHPEYLPPGYVVFESNRGQLLVATFNVSTRKLTGEPQTVLDHFSSADFAVSRSGTLAYLTGDAAAGAPRSLVWVSRQGVEEPIAAAPQRAYTLLRISPDGTRVALDIRDSGNDIWTWDLQRQVLTQITFDPAEDATPAWIDNERIAFSSSRASTRDLYVQRADGTGTAERLTSTTQFMVLGSASPDGRQLAFMQNGNLGLLSLDKLDLPRQGESASAVKPHRIRELTNTTWVEDNPEISPDGRWLAYQSVEEGRSEVFVRSLEDWDRFRIKVSTSGGRTPAWARNGRELFYLDERNMLTSVPVQAGPMFIAGKPVKVLSTAYVATPGNRAYDIAPDGQRFLMIKEKEPAGPPPTPPSIMVVTNWDNDIKKAIGETR